MMFFNVARFQDVKCQKKFSASSEAYTLIPQVPCQHQVVYPASVRMPLRRASTKVIYGNKGQTHLKHIYQELKFSTRKINMMTEINKDIYRQEQKHVVCQPEKSQRKQRHKEMSIEPNHPQLSQWLVQSVSWTMMVFGSLKFKWKDQRPVTCVHA